MTNIVGIVGSCKHAKAVSKGCKQLNDDFHLVDFNNKAIIESADCFVQTNMLKRKFLKRTESIGTQAYQYIEKSGKPFLVVESPAFREHLSYKRYGWWSYKWTEGNFNNENSPSDRWSKFVKETNIRIKDWHSPGDNIVIMCQKPTDSSLNTLHSKGIEFNDWLVNTIKEIRKHSDRKIVVRMHPKNTGYNGQLKLLTKQYKDVVVSRNTTTNKSQGGLGLDLDLSSAYCVVTYNSLSAVESVVRGIPTFALEDGSMVWPIAHKKLKNIENLNYNIDITQWCNDIAYCQWTGAEVKSGEMWSHLKPIMFPNA